MAAIQAAAFSRAGEKDICPAARAIALTPRPVELPGILLLHIGTDTIIDTVTNIDTAHLPARDAASDERSSGRSGRRFFQYAHGYPLHSRGVAVDKKVADVLLA